MKKKKFNYKAYLASRDWALKKEAIRERSGDTCERCHVRPHQSTHHVTYEHIGNEPLEDLLAVCNPCHEYLSAKRDHDPALDCIFSVIAFPRESIEALDDFARAVSSISGELVGVVLQGQFHPEVRFVNTWATEYFRKADGSAGLCAGLL